MLRRRHGHRGPRAPDMKNAGAPSIAPQPWPGPAGDNVTVTSSDTHTLYATSALTFRIDDAKALANVAQMLPNEENMRFDGACWTR